MKNTLALALVSVCVLGFTQIALAAPQTRGEFNNSVLLIHATNQEDRAYTCSFSYSYDYDEFGETKHRDQSGEFYVAPHTNNATVHQHPCACVNPHNLVGPQIQCN